MRRFILAALLALAPSLAAAQGLPSANQVYAGPTSGSASAPSFRALVPTDLAPLLSTPNTWTAVQTLTAGTRWGPTTAGVSTLARGEYYYDTTGSYAEHNSPFNLAIDLGGSAPSAVLPTQFNFTLCQGNNSTFVGCSGVFSQVGDRAGVSGSTKGVLYAANFNIAPTVARNNSPNDDAVGLVISNQGTAKGTEGIFIGHNSGIAGSEFAAAININAFADFAFLANGTYNYGLDFVGGGSATFANAATRIPNASWNVGRNAAGNADVNAWRVNSSNLVSLANDQVTIDPSAGTVTVPSGVVKIGSPNTGTLGVQHADTAANVLFAGGTKGIRFGNNASNSAIEGVDNTGLGSFQPLALNGSTLTFQTNGGTTALSMNTAQHSSFAGGAPSLTAGCNGAGSSVSGSDTSGTVTGQTAAATTCTLTFGTAFAAAPNCVAMGISSPLTTTATPSTATLIVNFASTANYKFTYFCPGA